MRIGIHLRFALVTLSFIASALAEDAPKDYDWVDREACGILGGMQESVDGDLHVGSPKCRRKARHRWSVSRRRRLNLEFLWFRGSHRPQLLFLPVQKPLHFLQARRGRA